MDTITQTVFGFVGSLGGWALWQYLVAVGVSGLVVFFAADDIRGNLFSARVIVEEGEGEEESIMPFSYFFWERLGMGALWISLPALGLGVIAFLVGLVGGLDGTGQFF